MFGIHRPKQKGNGLKQFKTFVLCLFVGLLTCQMGCAQTSFPSKPIRIWVGYPPGGPVDVLARIYGPRLSKNLGQPVVVENKPGASGAMAADQMLRSPADGHSLLLAPVTIAIIPNLLNKLPYDAGVDLFPMAWIAQAPFVLVAHPKLGIKNLSELIAYAKKHPGEINFASASVGGVPHLAGELFNTVAGIKMTHIPYKGAAPATADLLSGQVNLMFDSVVSALPYIKSQRLIALGVTGPKRIAALPDVASISESLQGYEASGWYGFFVSKDVPKQMLQVIHQEINRLTVSEEVERLLRFNGLEPVAASQSEFSAYFASELLKWKRVVRESDIQSN